MRTRPLIGISACLMGDPVRHNGGHTRDKWIVDSLAKYVDFYPVCPEVMMGFGTPRDEINLLRVKKGEIKLINKKTKEDYTELAESTYREMNKSIEKLSLDGFIFMRKSPSCGLSDVKVEILGEENKVTRSTGLFAEFIKSNYPSIAKIDNGRLKNENLRELFLTQVFAHFNFKKLEMSIASLQNFHKEYKYVVMEYRHVVVSELGRIASSKKDLSINEVFDLYEELFFETISNATTKATKINALQHITGYLKKSLSSDDKENISDLMGDYKSGHLDFSVPENLIHFLLKKNSVEYFKSQKYFNRYPYQLKKMA
ncbi:MAG: DUF523 and DUF1722 domain-containing protein [Bacteriovoracaceae bacterium]|nr:DUF523 and DUF1722 domain-containing protein [Bacteriovoracaceae bacterium]